MQSGNRNRPSIHTLYNRSSPFCLCCFYVCIFFLFSNRCWMLLFSSFYLFVGRFDVRLPFGFDFGRTDKQLWCWTIFRMRSGNAYRNTVEATTTSFFHRQTISSTIAIPFQQSFGCTFCSPSRWASSLLCSFSHISIYIFLVWYFFLIIIIIF